MTEASQTIFLPDADATRTLGRLLAHGLPSAPPYPALLLEGDLGAGKTTLTRALVEALPGGDQAEPASPSFNIMNLYPTTPPVAHFDLYRLAGARLDDDAAEQLEDPAVLAVVEWAQFLAPAERPADALTLRWQPAPTGRRLELTASGPAAHALLARLAPDLERL